MMKNMGIRTKFMTALLVILFLGGALMMAWFYYSSRENVKAQAIEGASILSDSINQSVHAFMETGQQSALDAYLEKGRTISSVDEIRIVRSALLEKELGVKNGGEVKDALDQQVLDSGQALHQMVTAERGKAIRIISPVLAEKSCTACHTGVREGDVMALVRSTLVFQSSLDAMRQALIRAGFMQLLILLIVIGAIFVLVEKLIVNPLSSLVSAVDRVSNANLTQAVKVGANDEIGKLGARFNNMTGELKEIIKKVQAATNQITTSCNEILTASQEQASTAREQTAAVAETTTAAKELSATSEAVGESIKKVTQVVSHAVAGMVKIKESIDKTNGMLTSLGEKSQKIGKITELIDDVADQTNLLAVNASIEAARAGEQGRGFTVVADEIRKLADSTAKSTKDITGLIELIQHEMSNAILSMEKSILSVDEEARLAQQATERTKEIAMAANQQVSGAKQISDAMMSIDEAMRQIATGSKQSQDSVKLLTALAGELNQLASKFKL